MQLVVDKIARSFGINEIFKDISFMIDKGEKIGLVGVNGSGKTTLLRCLLAPETVDGGVVRFEPGLKIGYVEQGFQNIGTGSLWQFMLRSCPEIVTMREELAALEARSAQLEPGAELDGVLEEYARVTKRYEHVDGYNYEAFIKRVLIGLGFEEAVWDKTAEHFSGGQKTRMMLAAALVRQPDFLILDEPTNHLDIAMTEWLEKYLQEFKGGLLVVSHDRAFLDNIATRILEMEGGHLTSFKGNYSKYLVQKELQTATLEAAYASQQDYIARTEAYIRRFKAGIKSKMARGRQSQLDRLERMDAPVQHEEFALRLPPAPESAERVLILDNLSVGYGDNVLLHDIDLVLRKGEKVGLLGPNGTGKTTLLKTVLGELPPLKGTAQIGNRVKVGYFSQSYERLAPKQTLLDNFLVEYGFTEERTRSLLGGMLFHGDDVFKEIGTLSGGQKARLVLLKLVLDGANCLVLDEPTNHLDIMARETVEAALTAFDGTVLVVSHDRYFINKIADRILLLTNNGVKEYLGNYDYYLERTTAEKSGAVPTENKKDKKEKTQNDYFFQKQKQSEERKRQTKLKKAEAEIERLDEEIAKTQELLSSEEVAADYEKLMELSKLLEDLQKQQEEQYEIWEELESMAE